MTTNCTYAENTAYVAYVGDPKAVVAVNKDGDECTFTENVAIVTYTLYIKFNRTSETDCVFDVSSNAYSSTHKCVFYTLAEVNLQKQASTVPK